jgi:chromosome partitioning protein
MRTTQTVLSVLSHKGGVGKTTIATNIASAAHLAGLRTILVDGDTQGSAFDWFVARAKGSPLHGLAVVKADKPLPAEQFKDIAKGYEFVVWDGPPRIDAMTRAAAVNSDLVLLPLRAGPLEFWALEQTIKLLADAADIRKQTRRPPMRCMLMLNVVPPRAKLVGQMRDAIAKHLDNFREATGGPFELLELSIGNRVAFPNAMFTGGSVLTVEDDTDPAACEEVRALFEAVKAAAGAVRRAA